MNIEGNELEIKFYLSRRNEIEKKISALGKVIAPRVLESNLRFDTPGGSLSSEGKLLRLRRDTRTRVTYKGPGVSQGGAHLRQELEFTVSDFDTARALLEALGYQVYTIYEKYRTTYLVRDLEVVLDELPNGDFLEIEGPDAESIHGLAQQLGFNWDRRIMDSYTVLFERMRTQLGLTFRDLTFENFKGIDAKPEAIGLLPADE
ncbi:MAG: class IV adenylate cyclase [Anaerolineales bacterium]|nr:class IV adenylate cyclase [Anaerolineae bacterium]PWB51101.1 MAG: class IV adenylate cyclase [Anaerolineales bacterium]